MGGVWRGVVGWRWMEHGVVWRGFEVSVVW